MVSIVQIIFLILNIVWFLVLAQVIMSWLINFGILNTGQPAVVQIWQSLNKLLEPIYGPIRRVVPSFGGLDLAPLVVLIGIKAIEIIVGNNMSYLA